MTSAHSRETHQPAHPGSLNCVLAFCLKKLSTEHQSDWSDCCCAGWFECLLGTYHFICFALPFFNSIILMSYCFLCPHGLSPPGHRALGLSVRTSVDQVKIFVQGRISRPIKDSKLIFHMRMYLYETSRNIQEPWPIFHGPLTSDFGQIIKVKIFVQGRILSSTNGSKLIFHIRMYLYETSSYDLMTYISRSAKFRLWSIFHG